MSFLLTSFRFFGLETICNFLDKLRLESNRILKHALSWEHCPMKRNLLPGSWIKPPFPDSRQVHRKDFSFFALLEFNCLKNESQYIRRTHTSLLNQKHLLNYNKFFFINIVGLYYSRLLRELIRERTNHVLPRVGFCLLKIAKKNSFFWIFLAKLPVKRPNHVKIRSIWSSKLFNKLN